MRLTITDRAFADLSDIAAFSAASWGEERARLYTDALLDRLDGLVSYPRMGVQDEQDPDFRRLSIGRHVAFYQLDEDTILIVRILHMSQEPGSDLP